MGAKQLLYSDEARRSVMRGVDKLAFAEPVTFV